jgi:hypothetical protein
MTSGLDLELQRQLQRVSAPQELWRRIQTGTRTKGVPRVRWHLWASAATAALVLFFLMRGTADKLDFRSNDPEQIRAWVQSHAGIDVPLVSGRFVRFIGVALLPDSRHAVCVSYRVGGNKGKLVIAGGGSGGPKHTSMRYLSYGGAHILAWVAAGQSYAIAAPPENLQLTCALCHADRTASSFPERSG